MPVAVSNLHLFLYRDLPSISINERVVFTSRLPAEEGGAGEGVGPGVGRHKITLSKNMYVNFFLFQKIRLAEANLQISLSAYNFAFFGRLFLKKQKKITSKNLAKKII
jgi:hypothetical protein